MVRDGKASTADFVDIAKNSLIQEKDDQIYVFILN